MPVSGLLDNTTAISIGGLLAYDLGWEENYFRIGTSSATRKIICFNAQRGLIIEYLMSGYVIQGNNVIQNLTVYPDAPWMFVDQVRAVPFPDEVGNFLSSEGQFANTYAMMEVVYKSLPYAQGQQGYITFSFSEQVLALPADASGVTGFTWLSDGKNIPSESSPPFHYQTCVIVCHLLNQPPQAQGTISTFLDTVNTNTFFGFPAQCVKYAGVDIELSSSGYNSQGTGFTETQSWKFECRGFSWNKILNPRLFATAASVLAALDSPVPPLYATADYGPIFPLANG
jgi:hypothetical protein